MSNEYISVKDLASALGVSARTIQLKLKSGRIRGRRKDRRSWEAEVSSLPSEWQVRLAGTELLGSPGSAALATNTAGHGAPVRQPSLSTIGVLGRKPSQADRRRMEIAQRLRECPPDIKRCAWIKSVAFYFSVSESTVRRIEAEIRDFGIIGKPHKELGYTSFSPEAIAFLKGYYLEMIKDPGTDSKKTAFKVLQLKAKEEGWTIGSRATAYRILSGISPLLTLYAREGNRGLDNLFYISRDCMALRPFQIIIGDQHIFDFWIADYEAGIIRRPECYAWIDQGTKLVYGIAFARNHYNAQTVKESLRSGLYRHGPFECTYNDNGTSECAKATNQLIDDLMRMDMSMKDSAELDRNGSVYVIEGDDGAILDTARTPAELRKKRRIFANVRNAKAKDIERFFRTLETRLSARCLPGKVADPRANAAADEAERARLERQKAKRELLTELEFVQVVAEELIAYENSPHGALDGMTPRQALERKMREGWRQRPIDLSAVDFAMFERRMCAVHDGRILLNKRWYIGAAQTAHDGKLDDVGLWSIPNGRKVEIRYSEWNPDYAIANLGCGENPIRCLVPVTKTVMLDDIALQEAMASKREQMKAVRQAFDDLTSLIPDVTYRPPEPIIDITPDKIDRPEDDAPRRLAKPRPVITPFLSLADRATPRKRYRWCLEMLITGHDLNHDDSEFMLSYRKTDEYIEKSSRWALMEAKIAGGIE